MLSCAAHYQFDENGSRYKLESAIRLSPNGTLAGAATCAGNRCNPVMAGLPYGF